MPPRPPPPNSLGPGDPGYDRARAVWNGMIDRHPARIVWCHSADQVGAALRYATVEGLAVTVRGGGHNVAGTAVGDDAVLIDLSPMRRVEVDPAARIARAGGGCLLRDLDTATTPHGLACPAGVVSHTGLGGLALGGGYGWLARTFGLTCDHLVAAQVVLADGSVVTVDGDRHRELLWALRGGGDGYGIVTRFTLRLRPVGPVPYRVGVYPLTDAPDALAAYRAFAAGQPRTLHTVGALKYLGTDAWIPRELRGAPGLALTAASFPAPGEDFVPDLAPLFDAAPPAGTVERVMSYLDLQRLGGHSEPHGHRYFTKSCYLADLPGPAVERLVETARDMPSTRSSIDFEYLRGAIADIPDEDSAFPNRAAPYIVTVSAQWTDPTTDPQNIAWPRRGVQRLHRFRTNGVYVNYAQDDDLPSTSGDAWRRDRLAAVCQTYDPTGILRRSRDRAVDSARRLPATDWPAR